MPPADPRPTFEVWMNQLRAVVAANWGCGIAATLDTESWRGYYDDGFSPEDAFAEDNSYGDDC